MRVYIVRSAAGRVRTELPGMDRGARTIEARSLRRLKKVLNQLGKRNLPVLIHSGGGMADEALAMGRLLRPEGLDVAVAQTVLPLARPTTAACRKKQGKSAAAGLSMPACPSARRPAPLFSRRGRRRFVGVASLVGVHRSIHDSDESLVYL